jgi:hypothetical protein
MASLKRFSFVNKNRYLHKMFGPATQRNRAVRINAQAFGKVFFSQFGIEIERVGVASERIK